MVLSPLRHIRAGALGGLGSGLIATLLDLALLPAPERSPRGMLVMVSVVLSAFMLSGAVLGLAVLAFRAVGDGLARLSRRPWGAGFAACGVALAVAPVVALLVFRLASGRQAAKVLGPVPVQVLLVAVGSILCGLAIWAGLRLGRRLFEGRRGLCLAAGVGLLGVTVALFFADARLYRRLYEYLHHLVMGIYLCTGMLSVLCLWRGAARTGERPRQRRWLVNAGLGLLALAILGAGWWGRRVLSGDQLLRFAALELTTVAAKVLALIPLQTRAEAPLFLDTVTPSARIRRNKATFSVPDANVVLVSIDALRADHVGAYGYKRPVSPKIDALASSGVRFESAYCQAPLTCYSIPSLLTGDYLKSTLPLLSKSPPTLARILRARGYVTAAFYNASIFFCDDKRATVYGDRRFGFGYAETELREANQLTDRVIQYLQQQRSASSKRRKLFLWVHYFDAHEPYTHYHLRSFGPRPIDRYDSEIVFVDEAVGRLVASLHQLEGPTIFVLTSDHGEEFKEHGGNYHGSSLYEEQIRVPLVIAAPGLKPGVVRTPVQLVDVVPTILSLLSIRVPESVRGQSLVPELLGQGDPDRTAFAEVHTKKMVRFRHWKLIHDFRRSTYELYDLLTDYAERTNLIGRRPRETSQLKSLLHGWFDKLSALGSRGGEERPDGIDLGRIGDRRAVPKLSALVTDPSKESRWRQEAAQLLGQIQDRGAAEALWVAAADDDRLVAQEAAIALGEIKDKRARVLLPHVLSTTDVEVRMRAAIALARVDSSEATPALIEAMYSNNWEIQNRAAHYLGFVGDRRAIGPLLRLAKHLHLRSRIALALGRIGRRYPDARRPILKFLLGRVRDDTHADVRQRALGGLGFMGDRKAIRPLARYLITDPDLTWTPETLTRLGGVGGYWVPGLDFAPTRRGLLDGWGRCEKNPSASSDHYLGQTWCAMAATRSGVRFRIKRRPFPAQLMLRFRPIKTSLKGASLAVSINGHALPPQTVEIGWKRLRIETRTRIWRQGDNEVRLRIKPPRGRSVERAPAGVLAFDYMILADPGLDRRR